MVNVTLSVSNELHKRMKSFPEIKWTVVMRSAAEEKLKYLEEIRKEKDPLKIYSYKKLAKEGEDASKLFKY